jgi:amino acid adenylation domain-containing protein
VTTLLRPVSLASRFLSSAERVADRPALDVAGTPVSYAELRRRAAAVAGALEASSPPEPKLTAVFASRSATSYAGVLGALFRGHGYVPLNPRYPAERNREILERSGCAAVVVDEASVEPATAVLERLRRPLCVVLPDRAPSEATRRRLAPHDAVGVGRDHAEDAVAADPDDPAYLLFTSGSTGRPKGVVVRQANVRAFLDAVGERYELDQRDRLSQMFDLTFDLSVFDLFVGWERGACVCVPRPGEELKASSFIRSAGLTAWFSVPSVAMLLHRLRLLRPGSFPGLRLSLFCGEALPSALARAWAAAAPASTVENLYGPTEATIACTAHRLGPQDADGLVPIGAPLGETRLQVVDEELNELPPGRPGELVAAGPQVVEGYLDDDAATARSFVEIPGLGRAYRTGDRVVARPDGELAFLGRLDSQIKVLGHRVELEEVEVTIREEASVDTIAVGWPRTETGAAGIVALVAGEVDVATLRQRLAGRLPGYMVPREFRVVGDLPLNANGKRDRRAAAALVEEA